MLTSVGSALEVLQLLSVMFEAQAVNVTQQFLPAKRRAEVKASKI